VAQVYVPLRQTPFGLAGRVLVRTQGEATLSADILREAIHALDPDMPVENTQTLDDLRDTFLTTPRLTATLLTTFAALAFVVTVTGIIGVIATSVSARTQEFGVRMALGASRSGVLALVARQGLVLVALGLAVGVTGAIAAGRVLAAYLYETRPTDPLIYAAVAFVFLIAGGLACIGPAWRATTADPLLALRAD
jgi:ABC-type antimicrobial peptide transport system permease subunit